MRRTILTFSKLSKQCHKLPDVEYPYPMGISDNTYGEHPHPPLSCIIMGNMLTGANRFEQSAHRFNHLK